MLNEKVDCEQCIKKTAVQTLRLAETPVFYEITPIILLVEVSIEPQISKPT